MIPKECKRLAEVDFPIAVVSKHSAREKSIRHGHPSTLHLWWARRPLAACRSMLLALLLPDPCDPHCPEDFKTKARGLLSKVQGTAGPKDVDLRHSLLKFIGDFANWDLATNSAYLEVSRGLVKAAHGEEPPLVVDPFAGGGSIPLEALRLGCEAFASDLNPVACLIQKVMLEDIPRHGPKLAEELRRVGKEVKEAAVEELAEFYPTDPDGAKPIAYLWARTVRCESPNCGAEIPLVKSFWLCKKPDRKKALRCSIIRKNSIPQLEFELFEPEKEADVHPGTAKNAQATCLACGKTMPAERVHAQLFHQQGGANVAFDEKGKRVGGALLLSVVTIMPGIQGRRYRLPVDYDYEAVYRSQERFNGIARLLNSAGETRIPMEKLPTPAGKKYSEDGLYYNFFPQARYGLETWSDFFNFRQNIALEKFAQLLRATSEEQSSLLLALGKLVDLSNTVCPWEPIAECPRNVLSNGRIKPSWSYAEGVPISSSSASFEKCVENLVSGIESCSLDNKTGSVEQATAQASPLPSDSVGIWFTDPPYYDAIPYSSLSDAFWVWLKRAILRNRFVLTNGNGLTPKKEEIIDDLELLRGIKKDKAKAAGIPVKDREFFEQNMTLAFKEGHRILSNSGIGCVVFAHQSTEGWEALLTGMIVGGLYITSSWPIATEMAHRLRARESAALATSVHLVCRPRPEDAPVGDWAEVLRELPNRVGDWMERLQNEGIRGADLVFACIGPALEIFSRYSKVETADGNEVRLAEYLEKVWEVVGRTALEQILGTAEAKARNGAAGVLEEDARLTALFLWTLQSTSETPEPVKGKRAWVETVSSVPAPKTKFIAPAGTPDWGDASDEEREKYAFIGHSTIGGASIGAEGENMDEEESPSRASKTNFNLPFDVARRFAQPLGIHLPEWEGRVIKTEKGVVHLLPISERARVLFGEEGAEAVADRLEKDPASAQLSLFEDAEGAVPELKVRGRKRKKGADISDEQLQTRREATTLDRVHAAMVLQASGRANALRALLKAEQDRGPDFVRLANALSALYPRGSEEKRLLDAMLLAVPR